MNLSKALLYSQLWQICMVVSAANSIRGKNSQSRSLRPDDENRIIGGEVRIADLLLPLQDGYLTHLFH